MKTAIPVEEAARRIPDGASLLVGGFMGVGSPHRLIDALVACGRRNLTLIGNDTARPGVGVAKLSTRYSIKLCKPDRVISLERHVIRQALTDPDA